MKRLKVLISAYACSPFQGSEPGMGWQFVKAISKYHDLWVITEKEKFEAEIEQELRKMPELRDHMIFYYIPKIRHRTLRKLWPPSYYWFYKSWQKKAYFLARALVDEIKFDIVHQLNMVGFREPGYLWKLNLPFVWGPVGGMSQFPWRFMFSVGINGAIFHFCRNLINALHMRFLPRPKKASQQAHGGLIAATAEMQEKMLRFWGEDSRIMCEIGQTERVADTFSIRERNCPLRLAWSGVHTSRKALPLLLKALVRLGGEVNWELDILGDGPRTNAWKNLAIRLGIEECCRWHGWLSRKKGMELISKCHVFVMTSLKDLTATVTLEAVSQGVPVICLDHCGFANVVGEECGIKIPVTNPNHVVVDIAHAIKTLWADESYRRRLCVGALRRAVDFSWKIKMNTINDIYVRLAGRNN